MLLDLIAGKTEPNIELKFQIACLQMKKRLTCLLNAKFLSTT